MKSIRIYCIITIFLLMACGKKNSAITEEQYEQLIDEMPMAEVEELLGDPIEKDGNKWLYHYKKEDREFLLTILFADDQLFVTSITSK